jgi:thiamine-phosphate pyrophosphorylase
VRGFVIGWSVTNPGQLAALDAMAPGTVDYLGVGPVYATATKTDASSPIGVTGIRAVSKTTTLPIVGIGGIDASNARAVMEAGAVGVAVISAICAAADPAAAAGQLRAAVGT